MDDSSSNRLLRSDRVAPERQITGPKNHRITSAGFVTADRMSQLQRALLSYANNFELYGRRIQMIVMNDSSCDPVEPAFFRSLVKCDFPAGIRYGGIREKENYVRQLARSGIDPGVATFALLGDRGEGYCTTGANRNSILLDTVGECIFTADDDTVCKTAFHPNRSLRVRFTGHNDPRETWFFDDRDKLFAEMKWESCDLLGEHERFLDKNLSEIIIQTPSELVDSEEACTHLLHELHFATPRVVATMNGIVGDSARYTAQWVLTSTGPTQERLLDDSAFRKALRSREIFGVARCHTVGHHKQFMSTTLGLANCDCNLLAPFFPVGRNEDGVFGMLNGLVKQHSFFGHIPVAVLHDGTIGRTYERFPAFRLSTLLIGLLSLITPPNSEMDMRDSLRFFGKQLQYVAKLSDEDFWRIMRDAAIGYLQNAVRHLVNVLKTFPDCPEYWKAEISTCCQHLTTMVRNDVDLVPIEFMRLMPPDVGKTMTREVVRKAGCLFHSWPDMLDSARELRRRGVRISVEHIPFRSRRPRCTT